MNLELAVLGWSALLAVVQMILFAVPANRELGSDYLAGPRDEGRTLQGRTARLQRAFNNHMEGLVLYAVAALLVSLAGATSGFTHLCALVYLAARLLYVPAYAFGWAPWRSLIWGAGFLATVAMLLVALI
jgi:uncharacterized MAPEG superfamily protein